MYEINRLIRLVQHAGVALLKRLIEAEVTGSEYPAELRKQQQKRIANRDRSKAVKPIIMSAVYSKKVARAAYALGDFLSLDYARIAAEAKTLRFSEFERIELTIRRCF